MVTPTCPKLRTLVFRGNFFSYIPDSFFVCMPALEVLDLSETNIKFLSSSISSLKNLTTLLLIGCLGLKYVSLSAELESLKCLNVSCCGIIEIPHGLEGLVNLIHLNLSELEQLTIQLFPEGILPKLTKLEYLEVSGRLTIEGNELEGLKRLSTFSGRLSSLHSYSSYVMSRQYQGSKHYSFGFQHGQEYVREVTSFLLNTVSVVSCRISKSERLPIILPEDVECLDIRECKAMTSLCDVPSLENTMDLKKYGIYGCEDVSHVACFSSSCQLCHSHFLQRLEELSLDSLPQLSVIFGFEHINGKTSRPVVAPDTFSCLKQFHISNCPKMKNLFQPELLPYLQNLEDIRVERCEALEEIIPAGVNSSNNYEYSLPKLRRLTLESLPNLKSICGERIICDALEVILVGNCPELKRITLSPPSSLRSIIVCGENREEWWESVEWDGSSSTAKNNLQRLLQFQDFAYFNL